jgi:hypothetical protein
MDNDARGIRRRKPGYSMKRGLNGPHLDDCAGVVHDEFTAGPDLHSVEDGGRTEDAHGRVSTLCDTDDHSSVASCLDHAKPQVTPDIRDKLLSRNSRSSTIISA